MRQVGHMPSSMPVALSDNNKVASTGGSTPTRWQSVKHNVSEGLHKIANFFSGLKNAVASLFERRPSVPSGPQFRPLAKDEAQTRIDQTVKIVGDKLAANPSATPPKLKTVFKGPDEANVNTFMRLTGSDTEGKAVADLVKPLMAETATAFWNQAQALLIKHGQDGKPANVQLDPAKDPSVNDPGERERRVGILTAINQELLQGILGKDGDTHHLPMAVQAAIAQVTDVALQHCDWDTTLPDSQKTADQRATEQKLRQVVVAHVLLTSLNAHASDLMGKMDQSQADMKTGVLLTSKILQSQFNGAMPGQKEQYLNVMIPAIQKGQAAMIPFGEAVYKHGSSWVGVGDYGTLLVGTVPE